MRYKPYPIRLPDYEELRKKSPRRVAAAIRAVRRIEDKNHQPLFDGPKMNDIEALEKAHQRLDQYYKWGREKIMEDRSETARKWCLVRRIRRRVPEKVRYEFDKKWQSKLYPGSVEYALDLLNGLIRAYYFEEELFNE